MFSNDCDIQAFIQTDAKQTISFDGGFIAYVTLGTGTINGQKVTNGDLVRGNNIEFHAELNSQIIIIRTEK